jgi:hypothetical protein
MSDFELAEKLTSQYPCLPCSKILSIVRKHREDEEHMHKLLDMAEWAEY